MYLENSVIRLRALEPEDLDIMYRWENNSAMWDVSLATEPYSRYILKEYIAYSDKTIYEKGQLRLMIELKDTGETVGAIDLFDFEPHHLRAGVGILVDERYRRNGYAAMALNLLCDYAFNFLYLNQLYAHVPVINQGSIVLFSHGGFERVGTLKQWVRSGGRFVDVEVLQKLKD